VRRISRFIWALFPRLKTYLGEVSTNGMVKRFLREELKGGVKDMGNSLNAVLPAAPIDLETHA